MLDPGIIGISGGWCAVLPTTISTEQVATPITHIKRWIGYNVIGFQVFVGIVEKRPFVVPFHLRAVDSPDREVHLCQSPGGLVTFLSVYGNIVYFSLMVFHKFLRLYKHTARTTAGVKHTSFIGFQHFHQ